MARSSLGLCTAVSSVLLAWPYACAAETQTYLIDGVRSQFRYEGSPWLPIRECQNFICEFGVEGSFDAGFDAETQQVVFSNVYLTLVGHEAVRAARPYLHRTARLVMPDAAMNVEEIPDPPDGTPTSAEWWFVALKNRPFVRLTEQGLAVYNSYNRTPVDGDAAGIGIEAFPVDLMELLDCDQSGVLDIQDANCLVATPHFPRLLAELNVLAGDLDGNGRVEFVDFLRLSEHFGEEGRYTEGDINGDGFVRFADFLILASNYSPTASDVATVPEPSCLHLLFLGLAAAVTIRRNFYRRTPSCKVSDVAARTYGKWTVAGPRSVYMGGSYSTRSANDGSERRFTTPGHDIGESLTQR